MIKSIFSEYKTGGSKLLIEKLNLQYFEPIDLLCKKASDHALKLKSMSKTNGKDLGIDIYINLCIGLIADVKECIRIRKEEIIPYINELSDKVTDGHDCSNCSTGCKVKHASKVPAIKDAHVRTKELFNTLERVATPIYEGENYPELYKTLRNEMIIIQTSVIEMFYLEESVLIPKILEEQKNIHAGN